jgi:hypothetical protein
MKTSNWADPGKDMYRTKQTPVGKDRKKEEGPIPTNDDFPQTWTDVKGERVLCAADVLPFDPSKRRLKTSPAQAQPAPDTDPYNAITMKIDYALGDLKEAAQMAMEQGEEPLAARIQDAIRKAYSALRYE